MSRSSVDFDDARVAVTGAGRGLGRHLVDALLDRGVGTVYALARAPEDVRSDPRVSAVALDLLDDATFVQAATATSPLDLLINNAAVAAFDTSMRAPMADIRREFEVNVFGTLAFTREVTARMHAGAHVVNVMSLLAHFAPSGMAGYAATKHALHALTNAMRPELAARGITVHGAYPGGIDTDMLAEFAGPKAPPRSVAEALLDGLASGEQEIYPDSESRTYHAAAQQTRKRE